MSPKVLDQILPRIPRLTNENVLVGFDTSDDAGVYRISADTALVQTVDFFTPIVDDPYLFGAIAAANSLSDVYAMGGKPISALSILAYPGGGDLDDLEDILRGGAEKMAEAGCVLLGGHSVNDPEIKFGYAVTGTIHPEAVRANTGARPGDLLVLTKAIGTGIISTALKRRIAAAGHVEASIQSMLRLNRIACDAMQAVGAHACTDVTGFGLLGHLREMALGSGVSAEVDSAAVPLLPGALEYAEAGAIPGGLKNNKGFVECVVEAEPSIPQPLLDLLYDPQTSGGLLIALPEQPAQKLLRMLPEAAPIGRILEKREKAIVVR